MITKAKKQGFRLALAVIFLALSNGNAETHKPLTLGLHPNVSLKTTLTMYQPLRDYLEQGLGREIILYSSADIKTYFGRLMQGQYDVAVAAPHMARVAQLKANFTPLVYYANPLSGKVIVAKTSAITESSGLRGKVIAFTAPYTFTNIAGWKWLRDHGLQPGVDIKVVELALHSHVAVALDRGDVDAAIIGSLPLHQLPQGLSSRIRVIGHTDVLPSQFFVANPKLPAALTARIKFLLLQFAKTEEGRNFLSSNGFEGLLPASDPVLKSLDPYAKLLLNVMENQN